MPSKVRASAVSPTSVTISWSAAQDDVAVKRYEVVRDGKRMAATRKRTLVDRKPTQGAKHAYTVRAIDAAGNRGKLSKAVVVAVPRKRLDTVAGPPGAGVPPAAPEPVPPGPDGSEGGTPPGAAPPPSPPVQTLTRAMVDRVFWRAGFGPTNADRAAWTGKPVTELLDWLTSTGPQMEATVPPPLTMGNGEIDPLVSSEEAIMDWLHDMQRSKNPLPERLAWWLHGHWAVSRDDDLPIEWILTYRERLRKFTDWELTRTRASVTSPSR